MALTLYYHIYICYFLHYLDLKMLVNVKIDVSWQKGLHFKVTNFNKLLVFIILNGKAKMKLVMIAFMYCGEIVKN